MEILVAPRHSNPRLWPSQAASWNVFSVADNSAKGSCRWTLYWADEKLPAKVTKRQIRSGKKFILRETRRKSFLSLCFLSGSFFQIIRFVVLRRWDGFRANSGCCGKSFLRSKLFLTSPTRRRQQIGVNKQTFIDSPTQSALCVCLKMEKTFITLCTFVATLRSPDALLTKWDSCHYIFIILWLCNTWNGLWSIPTVSTHDAKVYIGTKQETGFLHSFTSHQNREIEMYIMHKYLSQLVCIRVGCRMHFQKNGNKSPRIFQYFFRQCNPWNGFWQRMSSISRGKVSNCNPVF